MENLSCNCTVNTFFNSYKCYFNGNSDHTPFGGKGCDGSTCNCHKIGQQYIADVEMSDRGVIEKKTKNNPGSNYHP